MRTVTRIRGSFLLKLCGCRGDNVPGLYPDDDLANHSTISCGLGNLKVPVSKLDTIIGTMHSNLSSNRRFEAAAERIASLSRRSHAGPDSEVISI